MRNAELRRACLALVHNRVRAATPGADPLPIALGFQLEQGGISPRAMVALCAGVLRTAGGTPWRPSAELRTLLLEYRAASAEQGGGGDRPGTAARTGRARAAGADALP